MSDDNGEYNGELVSKSKIVPMEIRRDGSDYYLHRGNGNGNQRPLKSTDYGLLYAILRFEEERYKWGCRS